MKRALRVAPPGHWPHERSLGTVTLAYDDRHRRRWRLATDAGEPFLLDLEHTAVLADGAGLQLDDGGWLEVKAAPEKLIEVTASPDLLCRLAWHIGNRHLPAAFDGQRILIREDHVIAEMLKGLGAHLHHLDAPFTPEAGAYAGGHRHDH